MVFNRFSRTVRRIVLKRIEEYDALVYKTIDVGLIVNKTVDAKVLVQKTIDVGFKVQRKGSE